MKELVVGRITQLSQAAPSSGPSVLNDVLERHNRQLVEALRAAIKDGCSCDLMYGYRCGMHVYEKYLNGPCADVSTKPGEF